MNIGLKNLLLKTADDSFIVGHRNSEWTGFGPFMEEDIAFASMAQDKIGHAWALYKLVEQMEPDHSAEWLAFQRPLKEFKSCHLVELPNAEYDFSLIRHFLFDEAELLRYTLFLESSFEPLTHLAKKIKGELKYHTMHAETFLFQLANGNEVSKARMQSALNECFPYALGLFESFEGEKELIQEGIYPGEQVLKDKWLAAIADMIAEAGLKMPEFHAASSVEGGRNGYHSDFLLPLLTEMREVIAIDPNAEW